MSCPAAGNCTAAGELVDSSGKFEAFVVDELNGTWRLAIEIPGAGVLNQGGSEAVMSLSCGALHNCSAGGFYADPASPGRTEAFVASES